MLKVNGNQIMYIKIATDNYVINRVVPGGKLPWELFETAETLTLGNERVVKAGTSASLADTI